MDKQSKIALLKSKLTIYRNGLDRAKGKGNLYEAGEWLKNIKIVKKQLDDLL